MLLEFITAATLSIENYLDRKQTLTNGNLSSNSLQIRWLLGIISNLKYSSSGGLKLCDGQQISLLGSLDRIDIIPDVHYRHGYQVHLFSPPFVQGDMKPSKRPDSCLSHWAACQSPTVNLDFSDSAGVGEQVLAIISHSHPVFDAVC